MLLGGHGRAVHRPQPYRTHSFQPHGGTCLIVRCVSHSPTFPFRYAAGVDCMNELMKIIPTAPLLMVPVPGVVNVTEDTAV